MTEPITLPPGVALAILAFLLSLVPAGLFTWLWYLRRHDRALPARLVAGAFIIGLVLVIPAFQLENFASRLWRVISPATAHYFAGAVLPLLSLLDVVLTAVGTFVAVATVEEGLRYAVLRAWLKFSRTADQVFDGLVLGVAIGIGFATLENTIYFLGLFRQQQFDTLVFVFFLRFLISTLAHISFGGLMGTLIARGVFNLYQPGRYYIQAFFLPWFLHGLYDLLLGINQSFYAVLLLLAPLAVLITWTRRRDFFIINRQQGQLLAAPRAPQSRPAPLVERFFAKFNSPWNVPMTWLKHDRREAGPSSEMSSQ